MRSLGMRRSTARERVRGAMMTRLRRGRSPMVMGSSRVGMVVWGVGAGGVVWEGGGGGGVVGGGGRGRKRWFAGGRFGGGMGGSLGDAARGFRSLKRALR